MELDDAQCEALLVAFNLLLESAEEDEGRRYGVCSAVDSVIDRCTDVEVYEVLQSLGFAWADAMAGNGYLDPYFCHVAVHLGPWVGVNYKRRMQFMQFCVDSLTEFMQDRSRSTCTSNVVRGHYTRAHLCPCVIHFR